MSIWEDCIKCFSSASVMVLKLGNFSLNYVNKAFVKMLKGFKIFFFKNDEQSLGIPDF
jgi:hypothetical protein